MSPETTELVGYLAAFFTTFSFLPQVIHIWRTRQTAGLSLTMYLIFATGIILWLVYGLMLGSYPIIAANVVTLLLVLVIIGIKLKTE